jgi:hypothetical protein
MKINNHFIITFIPKRPELFNNRKRFSIGVWQLYKYIGEQNAINLISKIQTFTGEKAKFKYEVKYRKMGRILLYGR